MNVLCPACGGIGELDKEPLPGQHVLCPFCGTKYDYAPTVDDSNSDRHSAGLVNTDEKPVVLLTLEEANKLGITSDTSTDRITTGSKDEKGARISSSGVDFQDASHRVLMIFLSSVGGIIFIAWLLWLYGYMTAISDVEDGQSLIGYKMRRNGMNFISAGGYSYYFKHNTNM